MSRPTSVRGSLRATRRGLLFAGGTLGMTALMELRRAMHAPVGDAVRDRWVRRWARRCLDVFGLDAEVLHPERVPRDIRPRLVVANHRSPVDIAILLATFGGHVLSRGDLATWPVLGFAARRAGTLFVDRENNVSRVDALSEIRAKLKERRTVILFPEGRTFVGDEVRPFHAGAFAALRGLDAEVVPVGLAYDHGVEFWEESFVAHLGRVAARKRTTLVASIGVPVVATRRARELAADAQREVQALVDEARRRHGERIRGR